MKRLILFAVGLFLISCGSMTPEKTIEKYTNALREGKYAADLWDLEKFAKLYYSQYWEKAEDADRKRMIQIIQKTSENFAKMNQANVVNSNIKSMKRVEESESQVKLSVLYVRKSDPNVGLELTFLMQKENKKWKIINIEKITAPMGGTVDPLYLFKQNLPNLMRDLGYQARELNLKVIAQFFEEKFLNQPKDK